ncbi:MAG: amino acid deaminase, partial [Hafnia sp.]
MTVAAHKSAIMLTPSSARACVLNEDVCLPAAVIKAQALENNILWMQRYADTRGVSLAPHGKTSMTPWIFRQQQQAGAWAIGVGSAWQAQAAMACGIQRVLMANQLVGAPNMALIADLLADKDFDFHCMVDHPDNVADLGLFF